jgi:hypothetical protein
MTEKEAAAFVVEHGGLRQALTGCGKVTICVL